MSRKLKTPVENREDTTSVAISKKPPVASGASKSLARVRKPVAPITTSAPNTPSAPHTPSGTFARVRRWRGWWITGVIVVAAIALGVVPVALLANHYFGRHHIGEAAQIGTSWSVNLTSLTTTHKLSGSQAKDGYVFLVINVTVKNISNQPQTLSDLSFYGPIDASGKNYPASISFSGTVAPSKTAHGTLVAEVPTSLRSAIIEVDDENEDSFSNIWDITIPKS
ncbi:MAG TPA: DUF4352 domain-containing protein [Ktedonobacterales bacterium]|nr:DUF4352 domain-containing protein [Ktedonobacterales bacterium]